MSKNKQKKDEKIYRKSIEIWKQILINEAQELEIDISATELVVKLNKEKLDLLYKQLKYCRQRMEE